MSAETEELEPVRKIDVLPRAFLGAPYPNMIHWIDENVDPYMSTMTVQVTDENRKAGIYLATRSDASAPMTIDWGDGTSEEAEGNISRKVHEYSQPGRFIVSIGNVSVFSPNCNDDEWNSSTTDNTTVIEEVALGKYVRSVGNAGLLSCENLSNVKFPKAMTSLGISAMAECTRLSSMTLPDNISSIPTYAFKNCTSLSSIQLPKSLKTIGGNAFYNTRISKLVLPEGMLSVWGNDAFSYNPALTEVYVPSTAKHFGYHSFRADTKISAVNGTDISSWCGITFATDIANPMFYSHKLFLGNKLVTHADIPDEFTAVNPYAFNYGVDISSVHFPEGLKSIGDSAFLCCQLKGEVYIPDGVTRVGNWAFGRSTYSSIRIPDTVTYFGSSNCSSNKNLLSLCIPDSVTNEFTGCQGAVNIQTAYIGENVPGLGMNAFYYCQQLSSIHLGEKVSYIGNAAFFDCKKLSSIDLPAALTAIGDMGFQGAWLTSLALPENLVRIGDNGFSGNKIVGHLELPNKLSSIGNSAFANSINLSSVSIPSSLSSIGQNAFAECASMREFFVDEDNPNYKAVDGMLLTKDGKTLLGGVVGNVQIPDGVEAVGPGAFSVKPGLVDVQIPGTVTAIQDTAFANCQGLTSVTIPASVQTIGYRAFNWSRNIEYFEFLGDAPANVGREAFSGYWRQVIAKVPADTALWAGYSTGDTWNGLTIERHIA